MTDALIVGAIVLAAGAYLARRLWRTWSKRGTGCGCEHCPATRPPAGR